MESRAGDKTKILFWIWLGLITLVSLLPGGSLSDAQLLVSSSGFWEHVLCYGVLAALAVRAFSGAKAGVVLIGVFGAGIGFEVIQILFLGRTLNPLDVGANGLGLGVGFVLGRTLSFIA